MTVVKLYVYDLSNGLAKQLSQQLTGQQIDGIWHTSVVVFGKELFYGQGIHTTHPGKSHHGTPLQVIDIGETAIDQETFEEYLSDMREHYTAEKYHPLEFNCNSFTNDCIGFLTGRSIPPHIQELPADFLSTPFGAALRPTIDAMFRHPVTDSAGPFLHASNPQPGAFNVQPTTPESSSSRTRSAQEQTSTLLNPIRTCTHLTSFHSLLNTHRAVVAFFTNARCGPCGMIQPVFIELAKEIEGKDTIVFTKIDLGVAGSMQVADKWQVRITPTFLFFLDGKLVHELKGADARELRTQVNLLLFQLYPPHPHTSISLPAVESLSTQPILFSQVPTLDAVLDKLSSFMDTARDGQRSEAIEVLAGMVVPYLKARFAGKTQPLELSPIPATSTLLVNWARITSTLTELLPESSLFPLVDMWRLAVLDATVAVYLSSASNKPDSLSILLDKANASISNPFPDPPRFILTMLRFLSNGFANSSLALRIVGDAKKRVTAFLIQTLLCKNSGVRMAASSLAFNIAAWIQKGRVELVRKGNNTQDLLDGEGEWETEMVTAIIEAISREENEDILHRLAASLAFLLRLSPFHETQLRPLLEVLQGRDVLQNKLRGVQNEEVRKLIREVAMRLCP